MDSIPFVNLDHHNNTVPPPQIHVASLIVHVRPGHLPEISQWLERQSGVEIHSQSDQGKLAIVLECDHERAVLDLIDTLADMPGVLNAALIYHEIIDGEEDA